MRRLVIALTAVTLLVAACGDDDLSVLDAPGTPAAPPTSQAASGTTAAAPDTTAASDSTAAAPDETSPPTTSGAAGSEGAADEVAALMDLYEAAALRVTYRMDEGPDEMILTISKDPNREPPVSALIFGPDGEEGRFISIGDVSMICEGNECFEIPGGDEMAEMYLGPAMSLFAYTGAVAGTPGFTVEEGDEMVGGRFGPCFVYRRDVYGLDVQSDDDVEAIRQCIDAEYGFILLLQTLEAGTNEPRTVVELLDFGLPQAEDFEPTGTLVTLPTG
jgi:hypothetical protein